MTLAGRRLHALIVGHIAEVVACWCAYSLAGWKAMLLLSMTVLAIELGVFRRMTE